MLDAPPEGRYRSPMRRPTGSRAPEIAVVDLAACDRCGLCLPLCPPAAIHLVLADLIVDPQTCTGCRKCVAPCPVGALAMVAA
jgi:Na+-translocating ferredoxin:NAD+ oxidoreductase subunit B